MLGRLPDSRLERHIQYAVDDRIDEVETRNLDCGSRIGLKRDLVEFWAKLRQVPRQTVLPAFNEKLNSLKLRRIQPDSVTRSAAVDDDSRISAIVDGVGRSAAF